MRTLVVLMLWFSGAYGPYSTAKECHAAVATLNQQHPCLGAQQSDENPLVCLPLPDNCKAKPTKLIYDPLMNRGTAG